MIVELNLQQIEFLSHVLRSKICHDRYEEFEYKTKVNDRCVAWKQDEIKKCEDILKEIEKNKLNTNEISDDKNDAIEKAKIMIHFGNGGEVEVIDRSDKDGKWQKTSRPVWNWAYENYRIKFPSIKVTKKEKELMRQIWVKNKKTENVYAVLDKMYITEEYIDNHYFLDPDKQEWIEIESDSKKRLRHHYNGGQP